ncbi:MAG TPA: iron ABC transporter permease [Aggregatilineales bacterium]|nr:iron ABC transporter permease [Aggregatilineales bacterium]
MNIAHWPRILVSKLPGRESAARVPLHLVVPALMVAGAMLLPLAYLLVRAAGADAAAWQQLFRPRIAEVLGRSVLLAFTVTLSANVIAIPLAYLTTRTDLPGRRVWSVITVLPLVIPSYVGAFALIAALGPRGLLQQMLAGPLGLSRLPDIYGFPGAWLTLTLFAYPYVLLSARGALLGLDPALEDAARSLGDSPWMVFRRVTLPQLRPALLSGSLLVALYALSDFGAVSMLRYTTFTRAIYVQYSASFDRNLAALLALVLVAITVLLLTAEAREQRRARAYYRAAARRRQRVVRLGRWRWPALAFVMLVALVALVIPLSVMGFWLVRGIRAGETFQLLVGPAWRSVLASGLAAGAALLGALPVGLLVVRHGGRFSRLVERTSFVGYALPGIVVALALVFFGANFATPLYQTLALLVFAYVVRFMPQAVATVRAALLQISPRLEEAARGLGARTPRVLFTVTVPLVRSGLLSGAALVFLTSMKELPTTLLLAPTGYDTLATRVWSATEEAFYARAAAPALLLVAVSALSIGLILARDDAGR